MSSIVEGSDELLVHLHILEVLHVDLLNQLGVRPGPVAVSDVLLPMVV